MKVVNYQPNSIYISHKYENIKSNINELYIIKHDLGSSFIIECDSCVISFDDLFQLSVFYNHEINDEVLKVIQDIESIIKKYFKDFKYKK